MQSIESTKRFLSGIFFARISLALAWITLIFQQLLILFGSLASFFTGDNGRIEYSITADDEDFEIVPNGTIYTRRMLDRETKSTYNLVVTARDCAKDVDKRLSSTVQVRLKAQHFRPTDSRVQWFPMICVCVQTKISSLFAFAVNPIEAPRHSSWFSVSN
jgi:Cadherin domain